MKKKTIIIVGVLIIGFSLAMSAFIGTHRKNENDKYVIVETEDDEVPLTEQIPGQAPTQEELQNELSERLALVPANILTAMSNDGWTVTLTTEDLAQRYFAGIYSSVNAVTDSTIKTIWISNTERAVLKSTIHEIGHYVDYKSGIVNNSEEFTRIYNAEKDALEVQIGSAAYAKSSTQEYFAEAFQQCILDPERMKQTSPMTYSFIMTLVSQI